jgi:hypothetical protein
VLINSILLYFPLILFAPTKMNEFGGNIYIFILGELDNNKKWEKDDLI